MKGPYKISVELKCISCGDSSFIFNEDKTWVRCTRCEKEYPGGYNELVQFNQEDINQGIQETKNEMAKDLKETILKASKGNGRFRLK